MQSTDKTNLGEDLAAKDESLCTLKTLSSRDLLVVENLVADISKYTLDLELGTPPCGSQDLSSNTSLVLDALLISPVLTTLLLHLGHLLHGHLGINGTRDGVPGILGQSSLVLETREETANTEELLGLQQSRSLGDIGSANSVQDVKTEGLHLQVLNLKSGLLLKSLGDFRAFIALGPHADALDELLNKGCNALLAGFGALFLVCGKLIALLLRELVLLLFSSQLFLLLGCACGIELGLRISLGHDRWAHKIGRASCRERVF